MSPPPPIDAAEFDAHKNLSTVIVQFLCRNKDKGFSAKEIAQAVGIREEDVNSAMLKLGMADAVNSLIGNVALKRPPLQKDGKKPDRRARIEDVTINNVIYYRCRED